MHDCASRTPMIRTVAGVSGFSIDPHHEEAHWSRCYRREPYWRSDFDFEDYAPAYCVGYVGCAQYGGSFEDAETSLCANWVRIKGDSRLSLDEARCAIHAAWERVAANAADQITWQVEAAGDVGPRAPVAGALPAAHLLPELAQKSEAERREMAST